MSVTKSRDLNSLGVNVELFGEKNSGTRRRHKEQHAILRSMLIAFHKPYGVVSQFTQPSTARIEVPTLGGFGFPPNVYPIGRLDMDSEGLLLLSDERRITDSLLNPKSRVKKTYWAQVENIPSDTALERLREGVSVQGIETLPCAAYVITPQPDIPPRMPPIRVRQAIPTCWIALELIEGRNRQVRRMTAAVGFPTLRLIRVSVGNYELGTLRAGEWKEV